MSRNKKTILVSIILLGIVALGVSCAPRESRKAFAEPREPINWPVAHGGQLYAFYCTPCHGEKGDGSGFNAPFLDTKPRNHTDGVYMSGRTDQKLHDAVAGGGASVGLSNLMPPWKGTLSEEDIQDLVAYMRTLHPWIEPTKPVEEEKAKAKRVF